MRGDLILYKSSGKWYERAIVLATKGIYVHVAIQLSDVQVIAAGSRGIALFPYSAQDSRCVTVPIVPKYTTKIAVEQGLQWVADQLGREYGWVDIVTQAIKFMNPNNKLRLAREGSWDCSDFGTRYLQHCSIEMSDMYSDPYSNSPNDLARWAGLLGPRKG